MFKQRNNLSFSVVLLVGLVFGVLIAVGIPHFTYSQHAHSAFQNNEKLWFENGSSSYTIIVVSNSLTQSTGGLNTIQVSNGIVVEANNRECKDCVLSDFKSMTVEGLFNQVKTQCIWYFPFQYCNIAYDQVLGYPKRIDTYPYTLNGLERPSITVVSVILLKVK